MGNKRVSKRHRRQQDRAYLLGFLERLTEEEVQTLHFHILTGTKFATPEHAIPDHGFG